MWDHRSPGRARVFGHRGAMGYAPENTFASFTLALEQGVDAIELDVHLTADDAVVVIHDHRLERTTNGRGLVRAHTLAEIRALDAGRRFDLRFAGERVPTLAEVLDWARDRCALDIEIKGGPAPYPGIEARVVDLIHRHRMEDRTLVISFDHPTARRVKELAPEIATGVLYSGRSIDPTTLARAAGADALMPNWANVLTEDIERAHAAGLSVHPWATSEPDEIRSLLAMDVDSICSNHPDRVVAARAELGRGEGGSR
ncbi:MAG: glycerophosphodiester phosphodiesterase [Chloroflexota bacterium]|nr:glycerophosphodiester phosphodiesterase [Chloroflexota bacterium]